MQHDGGMLVGELKLAIEGKLVGELKLPILLQLLAGGCYIEMVGMLYVSGGHCSMSSMKLSSGY